MSSPDASNFDIAGEQAEQVYGVVCEFLTGKSLPGWLVRIIAGLASGLVLSSVLLILYSITVLIFISTPVARAILKIIAQFRKEGLPELNDITTETLSELLGVEITSEDIPTGTDAKGAIASARAIGGKLYDKLVQEFTKDGAVTPESGEAGAKAFTGFSARFAVSNAFISILAETLSLGQLEQFRELGTELAQVLGLGRLQRHVLGILMKNTIEIPYDAQLKARYRPSHLSDAQYVRGLHAGAFDEAKVRQELAYQGLSDDLINRMIVDLTPHLVESELARLIRYGQQTTEDAVRALTAQGIPPPTAQLKLNNTDLARVDSKVGEYVNALENQVLDGHIDLDTFRLLLQDTPLSELEQHWEAKIIGQKLEYPRAKLTLSQVQKALVDGIIDFDYLDQWMQNEGYSIDDQVTLEFLTLEKALAADEAAAKKKAIKDRKLAKVPAKH